MDRKSLFDVTRERLRRFACAHGGNVAITFALATLPIAGFVGAAVDYSHANSVKAAMQAAADSTALMLAKDVGSFGDTLVTQKANDYFKALFNKPEATDVLVSASYSKDIGSQVTVNASSTVKTDFMRIMGFSSLKVAVDSQVKWGSAKLQVALVLDNTLSMLEYGKINALKTATHALLTQLQAAAPTGNDVNVAIVPFADNVNVGTGNVNATWIDWSDWDAENGSDSSTTTCTTVSISKKGKPTKQCSTSITWVPANHNTWGGCVTDRDQDYDVKNTAPNPNDKLLPPTTPSTLFPADQPDWGCPVALKTLTNNWAALHSLVDQMQPVGVTNQTIGLAWGWLALTSGPPLNAPVKGPDVQQVIILLTDGLNTQNRWVSVFEPLKWLLIDQRTTQICNNIKAAGITIYAIQVNTGGDALSPLLPKCASAPEKFFHLTSPTQMVTTFNQIGTNISKLRIAN
jgi:Flp pilus assembly protein TadG